MIEIYRKGLRLDVPSTQIFTFKKAQNLNGIQNSYAYSNTVSLEKTANIKKLLELQELPSSKLNSLQNGYEVDIVLNGSIQLKGQRLKITKETKTKVDVYLLYSDSSIVARLKNTLINSVTQDLKYKKTSADRLERGFTNIQPLFPVAFAQTQSDTGQYVIEEMPQLISLQWLIKKMFSDIAYTVYGDFVEVGSPIEEYFVAPNAGIYQVYSGTGAGFSPSFDVNLTAFELLNQTLAYFNCYASVDDQYRTVIINSWTNLGNYKTNFKDYSQYFVDYEDFTFTSRLAKQNDLTYSDSEATFNSFFTNNLSSEDKSTYLASKFGSGSTRLFDDSEILEDGTIPLRANGEQGETSALRIYKVDKSQTYFTDYFEKGELRQGLGYKAVSVPMRVVYDTFHKQYTDFILSPLVQNLTFKYDAILAANFSLTEVFFIAQQSAYWIPLEISFSTNKDKINIKAFLIKEKKVPAPFLKNFNSVLLDFKQKAIFTKTYLLSMYRRGHYLNPSPTLPGVGAIPTTGGGLPSDIMQPANEYPWDVLIIKSYDDTKNRLFINEEFISSASLPRAFNMSAITENSIVIEANPFDVEPEISSASLYIQAIDTNGGISNEAYINIKHTGIARLESNYITMDTFVYEKSIFKIATVYMSPLTYAIGSRPNLNNTVTSVVPVSASAPNVSFDNVQVATPYEDVKVKTSAFSMKFTQSGNTPVTAFNLVADLSGVITTIASGSFNGTTGTTNIAAATRTLPSVSPGQVLRVYFTFGFLQEVFPVDRSVKVEITGLQVAITTIKTI